MAITDRTLILLEQLRIELDRSVDSVTRDLVGAWSRAWNELAYEYEAAIEELLTLGDGQWPRRGQIVRAQRAVNALKATQEAIQELSTNAGMTITTQVTGVIDTAERYARQIVGSQLPDTEQGRDILDRWTGTDDKQLRQIVTRTTKQVTSLLKPLSAESTAVMKSVLIRGVAVGDNPRTAARLMLERTNGAFEGGRRRAETIARTEMLDAHRRAATEQRTTNRTVTGWKWQCTLSSRTCPACLSLNGSEHPAGEHGPLGHQNCRCTAVPLTASWRDLGIDLDEPADRFPDARDWYESQTPETQRLIMGRERARRLEAGDLAWSDLSVRRGTPGWRDSFVVRPLAG